MSWRMAAVALAAVAALAGSPVRALSVAPCSLPELCDRAGTILTGRCLNVWEGTDPRTGMPVRRVTLRVREILKALEPGLSAGRLRRQGTHVFRQYNSPSLYGCDAEPPGYEIGEHVLVFLAPTSRIGLTAPVGMWQGKFRVIATGTSLRPSHVVLNSRNNSNLSVAAPAQQMLHPRTRMVLLGRVRSGVFTAWERNVLTRAESGPVDLERFVRLVRRLSRGGTP